MFANIKGWVDVGPDKPALFAMYEATEFRKLMVDVVCKAGFCILCGKATSTDLQLLRAA